MYLPAHFQERDRGKLFRFVREYNFGALISVHDGVPFATHIPFLLDESGESGMLTGHIARANPQWKDFGDGREALVIFQGPHGYITPSWYQEELSVPTWNYTAVHMYGVHASSPIPTRCWIFWSAWWSGRNAGSNSSGNSTPRRNGSEAR